MKITSVEIFQAKVESPTPGWFPVCVRVNTNEGVYGWGESGIPVMSGRDATMTMIKEIAPFILGMDPLENEVIWQKLFHGAYWSYGGGSIPFAAISAIDIALWDIKGKVANMPVYKLLGGKVNQKIKAYASQIQLGWGPISEPVVTPEQYAAEAKRAVADGFTAVKVDPLWTDDKGLCTNPQRVFRPNVSDWEWKKINTKHQLQVVSDRVGAIRDAVGDSVGIVIELHGMCDVNTAIQLGRELDQYGCLYYEEPSQSIDYRYTLELKKNVQTRVATGERIGSVWGFKQFIENRAIDVAQPDLGVVGGITEMKKTCDFANAYDVGIQMHCMAGPIACAATLQVEAAIPNFVYHECLQWNTLPVFTTIGKYDDMLLPQNGSFEVPERPGIGQELSEEAIAKSEIITVK
ncbi:mandelate racemase/muconate lactonizing enzyme family protein [Oscillibacter sp. GMB15532]|uniref:mandelate racemase/muconate lactonizing enzyme family protein n=1 Tax=Oscillibacter sp. GMB15532 TaxID=3230022 RepID=UPI0034DF4763